MNLKLLVLFFSIIILLLAAYWLVIKEKEKDSIIKIKLHIKILLGLIVGFVSATMGFGGAIMNVPI